MATKIRRDSNGSAWRRARARVLASADRCAICRREVVKGGDPLSPLAAQVDHIVPVSLGGHKTALSNLQLACRQCNRAKSNGVQAQAKAAVRTLKNWTSREW